MSQKAKHGKLPPAVPAVEPGMIIPKVIYQTFATHALPIELMKNVERLKWQNPGWTVSVV